MMYRFRAGLGAALAAALLFNLSGCSVNPATGRSSFTAFMSPAEEIRIGREEHPKIIKEFGGEYQDPAIRRYINEIGQRLARTSEMPDLKFTFTVLNSDIVNAFALPGGYVYVTTGLMALANNEAELASVIAHEIAHITGRHTAERYSRSVLAGFGVNTIGILTGGTLAQAAGVGAGAYLSGFSRSQESEADFIGVRYLNHTAYEMAAAESFLRSLQGHSALEAKLAGFGSGDQFSLFSTHPRTADRVDAAIAAARKQAPQSNRPYVGQVEYLSRLDGLYYGGDRDNGFVKGREFVHPKFGFRFEVPRGFRLFNGQTQVAAIGPETARIIFDVAGKSARGSMVHYLTRVWAPGLALTLVEPIEVSGMKAATGVAQVNSPSGPVDLRLVAIRFDPKTIYRFLFVSPSNLTKQLSEGFRHTTFSFHPLSPPEAATAQPLTVRLKAVEPGETVESVAREMPFEDLQVERFLALNGMPPGVKLRVGQLVKVIDD